MKQMGQFADVYAAGEAPIDGADKAALVTDFTGISSVSLKGENTSP